ncbi:hypothetical protein ACFSC6_02110 [Rufibacter sediminis]|uniref:Uncharacterized protein n=1 Tax=Rufibacter sediminis TaxID=2762756 RepID=A0ABR6VWX0_9BACT|nr:hypothetical protein [Rufibacter sediminis]MBC3541634.1 hypothetical protein [Rufibacter sediminis]
MKDKGLEISNNHIWAMPKLNKTQFLKGILNIVKDLKTFDILSLPSNTIDTLQSIKIEDSASKIG